ncbi:MAG: AraC family transcriptional regulator [Victivallaceae bacterium]|nr:AraC family transcriptional regulator [Victivallaceae bacterium]
MEFFNGVQFVCCGSVQTATLSPPRVFDDYYGIQYYHESDLMVKVDKDYERTELGSWVLITRPGPEFSYGPTLGTTARHSFVCFRGERIEQYIKSGLLPVCNRDPMIKITHPEHFYATLSQLIELLTPLEPRNYDRTVHLLEDLLLQLHEQPVIHNELPEYLRVPLDDLLEQLKMHPELSWDFKQEAVTCGISYPYFRHIFKLRYNLPPGKYLALRRLRKATLLLREGDEQIASIAEQCGFDDQFYFSRLFKQYYHFSPMRYRREFS